MAHILNDTQIRKCFGAIITDADESCLRPHGYVLRLGEAGRFLNTEEEFQIGKGQGAEKKGIIVEPGHAVGITSLERINLTQDVVEELFPGRALHGLLSPTTDLSREGVGAPTTQIDAGFKGTLNWTITNHSSKQARFLCGERIFRLTLLLLDEDESPESFYSGDYQDKDGYVSSQRLGPPTGMTSREWAAALEDADGDREFEALLKAGYPWGNFARKLKEINEHTGALVTRADLGTGIRELEEKFSTRIKELADKFSGELKEVRDGMFNAGAFLGVCVLTVLVNPNYLKSLIEQHPSVFGWAVVIAWGAFITRVILTRSRRN